MKKYIIIVIIAFVLILGILIGTVFTNDYRRSGGLDKELNCIKYYEDCMCIGALRIFESYPAQYDCQGLEFCKDINVTECR